ncbi:MAG: helix-turn-helix domain-containing protein [Alphaproteobacteria bacterium]
MGGRGQRVNGLRSEKGLHRMRRTAKSIPSQQCKRREGAISPHIWRIAGREPIRPGLRPTATEVMVRTHLLARSAYVSGARFERGRQGNDIAFRSGRKPASVMTKAAEGRAVALRLLAVPQTTASVLYGLYDLLGAAGVIWPALTGREASAVRFDVRIAARTTMPMACVGGIRIDPHCALDDDRGAEVVVVPDLIIRPDGDPRGRWPAETAWLRRKYQEGAMICSVCSGSILLAEAGLLDGRPATTHWAFQRTIATYYPHVQLDSERVLVAAGSDLQVVTSGGVSCWEDLVLYLTARYCGQQEAIRLAKVYLLGDRACGQLPYAAMVRPGAHGDEPVAEAEQWVQQNFARPNAVAGMVSASGLAERTFKRRFRKATGAAPITYVQTLRVERAKEMLETSLTPTDAISVAVGYDDPASFRRLFKRETGLTPGEYRRRFRAIGRIEAAPMAAA